MPSNNIKKDIEKWNEESSKAEELLKSIQSQRKDMIKNVCDLLIENGFYAYWYKDKWDRRDRDPKAGLLIRVCPLSISSEFEIHEEP